MNIGEAAAASGCHRETIRYYERIGLLPAPARRGSGYRSYAAADVERLRFISRGRELGFSLDEIRSLLRLASDPELSCAEVDALARKHLAEIQVRRQELARMARELQATIAACSGSQQRAACGVLGSLRAASPARKKGGDACSGIGDVHAGPARPPSSRPRVGESTRRVKRRL
jgi:MerR family mercuric resistance operon transcriptional regulator